MFDFLDPMADGYAVADLVVSRAGMITVAELCAWGLPSILIPLPTAAADHQTQNARVLAEAGAGVMLPQAELTAAAPGRTVGDACWMTARRRRQMAPRALARGNAAGRGGDCVKSVDADSADAGLSELAGNILH